MISRASSSAQSTQTRTSPHWRQLVLLERIEETKWFAGESALAEIARVAKEAKLTDLQLELVYQTCGLEDAPLSPEEISRLSFEAHSPAEVREAVAEAIKKMSSFVALSKMLP